MKIIETSIKRVYHNKISYIVSFIVFFATMSLYFFALTRSVSIDIFFKANDPLYIVFQFILSLINSVLISIALTMFWYTFKTRRDEIKTSIVETITSLFFAIASTGCYVCGTILLPTLGIATSFASLPFGGLEIKVLTIILLLISIKDFSKNILGLCDIKYYRNYEVLIDEKSSKLKFNGRAFDQLKPFFITFIFIFLILLLPTITKSLGFSKFMGANEEFSCPLKS